LTKQLQQSLTNIGADVELLSNSGYVRIFESAIYLVDRESMFDESDGGVNGIKMGKQGIVYFSGATGWNLDPTKPNDFSHYETFSSV